MSSSLLTRPRRRGTTSALVATAPRTDRFELYLDDALVAAVVELENGHLCAMEWDGEQFAVLRQQFFTAAGARRAVRRRAGGGVWWVQPA